MLIYLKLIIQEAFQKELSFQMQNQIKATNFHRNQTELLLTNQKNQVILLVVRNQQ
jgi:hypothetical protein